MELNALTAMDGDMCMREWFHRKQRCSLNMRGGGCEARRYPSRARCVGGDESDD